MEPPILETIMPSFRAKKGFKFGGPCRSRENDGDPATRPAKKKNLTKEYNYGQKLSKRFTQADYSNNKAHTLAIKLAIYSNIF